MSESGSTAAAGWIREQGLVLRPWTYRDVPEMVELFDTDEMGRRTALPYPFTATDATAHVGRALDGSERGFHHYAITTDGGAPLGEVILFSRDEDTCELTYAVGSGHRGSGYAARAVLAMLPLARSLGYRRAVLTISDDNARSIRTAKEAGFVLSDLPLGDGPGKQYVLHVSVWVRDL